MKRNKVTLDLLIDEAQDIVRNLTPRYGHPYGGYYLYDNQQYENWKNLTIRFLSANFPEDRCITDFEQKVRLFETDNQEKCHFEALIALLNSCHSIPVLPKNIIKESEMRESAININVNQHQSQHQEQTQIIDIFLEAIRDEITGRQLKELKAIVKEEPNPEKAKSKILDKVKTWGENISASIIANIITNPSVWAGLM